MRYQHPDLDEITVFLKGIRDPSVQLNMANKTDFGMVVAKQTENEIWYRGYGNDQYVYYARKGEKQFLGGAFEVESYQDLEK